ncbi:MAG: GNAT family N-acetyltransferase [Spirochaetales bacterium]
MNWRLLDVKDIPFALQLIGSREYECEHLFSRLLKKQFQDRLSPDCLWLISLEGGKGGLLYVSKEGLILPFFPFLEEGKSLSHKYLKDFEEIGSIGISKIYSIVGKLPYVQAIERGLHLKGGIWIDYHLMTFEKESPLPFQPAIEGFHIHLAKETDLQGLLPLQLLYEKEEVLIKTDALDPQKTRSDLKLALKEQILLYGEYKGQIVSKAGTNARGKQYDQIGGVYTLPPYRGQHFARTLMIQLIHILRTEQKNACLFVKTTNIPAIHLYEALNFIHRGAFRIHYV